MTPLPAASLTACLAWSSRPLYSKLRRGGRKRGGAVMCGGRRDPPVRQEDVAAVHAVHYGGWHRVDCV